MKGLTSSRKQKKHSLYFSAFLWASSALPDLQDLCRNCMYFSFFFNIPGSSFVRTFTDLYAFIIRSFVFWLYNIHVQNMFFISTKWICSWRECILVSPGTDRGCFKFSLMKRCTVHEKYRCKQSNILRLLKKSVSTKEILSVLFEIHYNK